MYGEAWVGETDREVEELLRDQLEEDAERRARAAEKGDCCPTCGFSESEHSPQDSERCVESFLAGELPLSKLHAEKKT